MRPHSVVVAKDQHSVLASYSLNPDYGRKRYMIANNRNIVDVSLQARRLAGAQQPIGELRHGFGSRETIQESIARITSPEDPRPRLASLPDDARAAVAAGRVAVKWPSAVVTAVRPSGLTLGLAG